MTRDEFCQIIGVTPDSGPAFVVYGITEDSRRVRPGAVFVARSGTKQDGHAYAEAAVAAGAVAIVGDRPAITALHGVPYFPVDSPRAALGRVAHRLAGEPTRAMTVIGVTGTNGKTSTAMLVQSILQQSGAPCARFGTIGYDIGGEIIDAPLTTPSGEALAELFASARERGCCAAVMEASSHALAQDRTAGIAWDAAAITNLTQDHLDYHASFDAYRAAKLRLFLEAGPDAVGIVNVGDPSAAYYLEHMPCRPVSFGAGGDYSAHDVVSTMHDTRFLLESPRGTTPVRLRLLGLFAVENALCAAAICAELGTPLEHVVAGLEALAAVPGRFEPVAQGYPFQVVVDYAHTDDALRNVLVAARAVCRGRIVTVFGCGGDRDRGKRPKMAAAVAAGSDAAILTSDNPRTEDPQRILDDAEAGFGPAAWQRDREYRVIADRRAAIFAAIAAAQPGDMVVIAGKGHEDYQILGTQKIHFDDREVAREALAERQ